MAANTLEYLVTLVEDVKQSGDPRVADWFLVRSPLPIITLFFLYMIMVIYGPRFMEKRPAFKLKYILLVYNTFQVGLSAYMFYEFFISAFKARYNLTCQPIDTSTEPLALRMADVCWWFFFSKIIDLADTIFFVLRKKNNQLTFLHVYHHSTMIFNWWLGVKYAPGGQLFSTPAIFMTGVDNMNIQSNNAVQPSFLCLRMLNFNSNTVRGYLCMGSAYMGEVFDPLLMAQISNSFFCAMLNSLVHVVMYSYYLLSSLGAWIQPYLWWKRYLTQFQIVQFVLIVIHISIGHYNQCDFPWILSYALAVYCLTLMVFFANFYIQSYIRKAKKQS